MATKVYLHIGTPKSGTTYIQTILWRNQANLSAAGVLLPGEKKFDHNRIASLARNSKPSNQILETWSRIEREIQQWPGTVVISNEWLSLATEKQIQRFVGKLKSAEVEVIVTARPLVSAVPAAWQEALKLGFSSSIDEFAAGLKEPDRTGRWWWGTIDAAVVSSRWAAVLPADQIHIVTVPPRSLGPGLLWKRFAEACGIEPDICAIEDATANESVGAESARLLQLLGPELRDAVSADSGHWTVPYKWLRSFLSHSLLAPLGGSKIGLSAEQLEILEARSEAMVAALGASRHHIHGDLSELKSDALPNSIHPEDVPDSDVLAVALKVIPQLIQRAYEESRRADRAHKKLAALEKRLQDSSLPEGLTSNTKGTSAGRINKKILPVSPLKKLKSRYLDT